MKEETNDTETTMEERGGLSASASTTDDQTQNHAEQATDSRRIVSSDTTFDTTAQRLWTPGPWRWNTHFTRLAQINERGIARVNIITDIEGLPSKANARLIAAAPDLFEALDRLMGYVDSPCGGCGERNAPSEVFAQARAAMDKALGVGE